MTRKEAAIAHVIASTDYHPRFAGWLYEHWAVYVEGEGRCGDAGASAMSLQPLSGKAQDFTTWAKTPPAYGAAGSVWERMIIELAEQGEPRFVAILREHVRTGVIRSTRAQAALNLTSADAVS